jgi:hypothetical protein
MKQGIPSRRTRGRGNTRGRQQSNIRNQQMDSNGPAGRLRGTPQQIFDRYSALARDASSSGDMVLAENLWQHAEHYARLLSASQPQQQQQNQPQQGGNGQRYGNGRDDQYDFDDQDDDGSSGDSQQQPRRNEPVEPLVLKSEPDAAAPAAKSSAPEPAPAPQADPAESEQPSTPPVWTKEDAQAASEEAATERPAAPRRRRRTRFPRQADGAENTASEQGSDDGNGQAKDAAPAEAPTLSLPDDPSPAALVDLLTRAEETAPRRKRAANSDSSDS